MSHVETVADVGSRGLDDGDTSTSSDADDDRSAPLGDDGTLVIRSIDPFSAGALLAVQSTILGVIGLALISTITSALTYAIPIAIVSYVVGTLIVFLWNIAAALVGGVRIHIDGASASR